MQLLARIIFTTAIFLSAAPVFSAPATHAKAASIKGVSTRMQPDRRPFPQLLQPAYRDWAKQPGEMLGFWLYTGPDSIKDQARRCDANATSLHAPMHPVPAESDLKAAHAPFNASIKNALREQDMCAGIGIGEHNNAWFVWYPEWFQKLYPHAFMRAMNGRVIRAGNNLWPAVDDPVITKLSCEQMQTAVNQLKDEKRVRYWVIGGEQGYPDYFALPVGDYRPASRRHYRAWQLENGLAAKPEFGKPQWYGFRESALAERFGLYTAHLHKADPSRPALIPTHGNPFALNLRHKLAYPVSDLAGASDGFEAGPISIDDDAERVIRWTLDQQTSFGLPVAAPRLGNKQLDPSAVGGGKSFSPQSLRRYVYEAFGLGAWHIGLVQWWGTLPDGEWGIAGTAAEAECKKVFGEIRKATPYLEGCSRLQPQVGLLISDETWLRWWQDRWTLVYDEAVKRGWSVLPLVDDQVSPELAEEVPVIVSVDNPVVSEKLRRSLSAYLKAGGKIISIGEFAVKDENDKTASPLKGANVLSVREAKDAPEVEVIHQTQTPSGANTWRSEVKSLPVEKLEEAISKSADLRPITLIDTQNESLAEGVEALHLTDGTNLVVVLINRSDRLRELEIKPSRLTSQTLGSWTTKDALTGENVPGAKVTLDADGTAIIVLEPAVGTDAADDELKSTEQAVKQWKRQGADVDFFSGQLVQAKTHLGAGRCAKAFALARTVTRGLALKSVISAENGVCRIKVDVIHASGKPARDAQVRLRFVPGPWQWHQVSEVRPGIYELSLSEKDLPHIYNPSTEKYELPNGPIQIVIDASLNGSRGGARKFLHLSIRAS